MLFVEHPRCRYTRSPLVEVICQLRFPTILSIDAKEPADFQETIRHAFPRYAVKKDQPAPRITGLGTPQPKVAQVPPVNNYTFISEDGFWKLNLTKDFISLSTLRYTCWEDFASQLDKALASFIQIYQPDAFSRVGLRYVNAFSRKALGLTDLLWDDLIQTPYIGILGEPDVDEKEVTKCSVDIEKRLPEDCRLKVHAGPGLLGARGKQDPEPRFILDQDLSCSGSLPIDQVAARLEKLHGYAGQLFHGAITDELHNAMGPIAVS